MNYSIKQVADRVGMTVPTLRYYDREGLLPFIERKDNGTRVFKDEDFQSLEVITCLKKSGLSIKDIRTYIDLCEVGDDSLEERRTLFLERKEDVEAQMEELRGIMATIEKKIKYYDDAIDAGTEAIHKKTHKITS